MSDGISSIKKIKAMEWVIVLEKSGICSFISQERPFDRDLSRDSVEACQSDLLGWGFHAGKQQEQGEVWACVEFPRNSKGSSMAEENEREKAVEVAVTSGFVDHCKDSGFYYKCYLHNLNHAYLLNLVFTSCLCIPYTCAVQYGSH